MAAGYPARQDVPVMGLFGNGRQAKAHALGLYINNIVRLSKEVH
jgi:ornithine cyclodeaminase/alanine dehydrogenase-like protein (mu-crystallin family)